MAAKSIPLEPSVGDDRRFQIAVLTNPKHAYGRNIIRGASRYLRENELPVDAHIVATDSPFDTARLENFDGFLEATPEPRLAPWRKSHPIVSIDNPSAGKDSVSMPMDNHSIGRLAARSLHAKGVTSYGYYDGSRGNSPRVKQRSEERLEGFREELEALGVVDLEHRLKTHTPRSSEACRRWLSGLTKPVGIFGFNDLGCIEVAEGSRILNLSVPEEVAIIGVDNDKLLCSLCHPPLSSIDPGTSEIAYHAIGVLVEMLSSDRKSSLDLEAPELRLVSRESTGQSSVANEIIQTALTAISSDLSKPKLTAGNVAVRSGVSLRVLEELFKEHLGQTIREVILRKRIEHFKLLLRTTDMTVERISEGLNVEATSLRRSFKRLEGMLPGAYRRSFRNPPAKHSRSASRIRPRSINICFINELQGQSAFDFLRGAQDHALQFDDVILSIRTVDFDHSDIEWLPTESDEPDYYDGFIAPPPMRLPPSAIGSKPIVYLDHQRHHELAWSVSIDNHELGVLAAHHFLRKGHRSFIYCDLPDRETSNSKLRTDLRTSERFRGFHETLVAAGIKDGADFKTVELEDLDPPDWLKQLPKPCAIFAFNDTVAMLLLGHCHYAGIQVPEEIAILGTDNDELLCNLSHPTLSSIEVGFRRLGSEAMRVVVEAVRSGHPTPSDIITLLPGHLIERESSRLVAHRDPTLMKAVEFIEHSYPESLSVNRIASASGVSRRTLESRFRDLLDTSVANYLQEIRLDRAKALLAGTNRPIAEVSEKTGFRHARHFSQVFGTRMGVTPRTFRLQRGSFT